MQLLVHVQTDPANEIKHVHCLPNNFYTKHTFIQSAINDSGQINLNRRVFDPNHVVLFTNRHLVRTKHRYSLYLCLATSIGHHLDLCFLNPRGIVYQQTMFYNTRVWTRSSFSLNIINMFLLNPRGIVYQQTVL